MIADELKHIGEIDVTNWDFADLLQKDIKDLEVSRSLRRLGRIQITDWEFKDVLPAVDRLAHKQIDLADIFRRTANYRVTEWDFRDILPGRSAGTAEQVANPSAEPQAAAELAPRIEGFLAYLLEGLVDRPDLARIDVRETEPGVLTATLLLTPRDAANLIGHGGHSAAALRRILQMAALRRGVHVLLRVVSSGDGAPA